MAEIRRLSLAVALVLVTMAQEPLPPGDQPKIVEPGGAGKAPSDAVVLFDGTDLSNWTTGDGGAPACEVADGAMTCVTGSGSLASKERFRSAQIHLEFAVPDMPDQTGQARGNSGVFLQGRYEIQILDSYNNSTYPNGACGALYGQSPPLVNAARPPGEWQTYDIVFHAPRCAEDGTLLERGAVTVLWNGVFVQDHVRIRPTGRGCVEDGLGEPGPLVLQDHNYPGAPVTAMRFRNIWFRPLD